MILIVLLVSSDREKMERGREAKKVDGETSYLLFVYSEQVTGTTNTVPGTITQRLTFIHLPIGPHSWIKMI